MANNVLVGVEKEQPFSTPSQVFKATHTQDGVRLPFRYRSYISFSYGGKVIEDYNLLVTTEGTLDRQIYASFQDITDESTVANGQRFWGTRFTNNQLSLALATDGMTEVQLDQFKRDFSPGVARELILAEHPNRAIMARVAAPPQMAMLPFGTKDKIYIRNNINGKLNSTEYPTEITLYKGIINLTFITDEPFWYSRYNILAPSVTEEGIWGIIPLDQEPKRLQYTLSKLYNQVVTVRYREKISSNSSGSKIVSRLLRLDEIILPENADNASEYIWKGKFKYWDTFNNPQIIYLTYPDEILAISGAVANTLGDADYTKIILEDNIPHLLMLNPQFNFIMGEDFYSSDVNVYDETKIFNNTSTTAKNLESMHGAHIDYFGWVSTGEEYNNWSQTFDLTPNNPGFLYYAGTAPSKPIMSFDFTPTLEETFSEGPYGYIMEPYSKYSVGINNAYLESKENYVAVNDKKFIFTTPSLLTGYNQALAILEGLSNGDDFSSVLLKFKEGINEYYSRAYTVFCANNLKIVTQRDGKTFYNESNGTITNDFIVQMKYDIAWLLKDGNQQLFPIHVSFNSKTGQALATMYTRIGISTVSADGSIQASNKIIQIAQNVGDMVRSKYLTLEDRNYLKWNGTIDADQCSIITTNYSTGLKNFTIRYRNMYY